MSNSKRKLKEADDALRASFPHYFEIKKRDDPYVSQGAIEAATATAAFVKG